MTCERSARGVVHHPGSVAAGLDSRSRRGVDSPLRGSAGSSRPALRGRTVQWHQQRSAPTPPASASSSLTDLTGSIAVTIASRPERRSSSGVTASTRPVDSRSTNDNPAAGTDRCRTPFPLRPAKAPRPTEPISRPAQRPQSTCALQLETALNDIRSPTSAARKPPQRAPACAGGCTDFRGPRREGHHGPVR